MALTTRAQLLSAMKAAQRPSFGRTGNGANTNSVWTSLFNVASNNGPGVLAGTSTTQGVVPDDTTAGCPVLDSFNGLTGYLAAMEFNCCLIAGAKVRIADLLFKSGAHAFNATDTLASQPSFAARVPGTDYTQCELWVETVTAFTGTPTFTITYTNDAGTPAQSTTYTATGALATNVMARLPLASGDRGIQKVESVTCTIASAGTFNVLVLRTLVPALHSTVHGLQDNSIGPDLTFLPILYDTTALFEMFSQDAGGSILAHDTMLTVIKA